MPVRLAVLLVVAGCLIVAREARHLVFSGDDWTFLLDRRAWDADVFLRPHGEHLSALPVLAYKGLLAVFGAGSYAPFMALALLVHGLACLTLYALARRHVGPWAALAPAAILVLLGPAWHDLLWAFQVGYSGSVAAGLAAVLCLERGDRRGDAAAAGLLVVALGCSSIGLAMVVLAAVAVALERPAGWRRGWVAGVPLALYALWYAGYGVGALRGENVDGVPGYVARAASAAAASVTGLARTDVSPYLVSTAYGRYVALAAAVVLVAGLVRGVRVPPLTWAALAAAGSLWVAQGLAFFPAGREAEQSRYQYAAAALVLLAAASAAQGWRPSRRTGAGLAIVTLLVVGSNTAMLHQRAAFWTDNSLHVAAETGAIEIARDVVAPGFVPEDPFTAAAIGVHNLPVTAGPYLSAADEHGSVADGPEEIMRRPEAIRQAADLVLANAERLRLRPVAPGAGGGCPGAAAEALAVPGTLTVRNPPGAPAQLELRRFAARFRFVRLEVRGGTEARLRLPRDRSDVPWRARAAPGSRLRLCLGGATRAASRARPASAGSRRAAPG